VGLSDAGVRHEAAAAIRHWWGVSVGVVWRWRKALGVGRTDTESSRHVLERAVITRGKRLHLDFPVTDQASQGDPVAPATSEADRILTAGEIAALERANILRALRATTGKIYGEDGAAKLLGLRPTTLASQMKALGIFGGRGSRRQ
jgi:hypothetical protein